MELIWIITDLTILPSILLVVLCGLLKRRHARKETAASINWFLLENSSLGQEFAVSDVCVYRGLRSWPGLKQCFPLFIWRSGLLKVKFTLGPCLWPPPGGFTWRDPHCWQSFTLFHKSLPGREISKVHFELSAWDLPAICHGRRVITGAPSWRRSVRGEALPLQQDHHLCISHC